jgi:O-antigen ligase
VLDARATLSRAPFVGRHASQSLNVVALALGAALVCAYELTTRSGLIIPIAISLIPLVVFFVTRPTALVIALGASIPAVQSIAGTSVNLHVSASDVLLVLFGAAILAEVALTGSARVIRVLRPIRFPLTQYCVLLLLLLAFHGHLSDLIQTAQRFELFLLPVLVGAYVAIRGRHVRLLQAYIVATGVLGALWPTHVIEIQKNPMGQMIANAILLIVAVPALRRFRFTLPVFVVSLLLTESRGAIVAAMVGVVVIAFMHGGRSPRIIVARLVPTIALGVLALVLIVPTSVQERITTFSASAQNPGATTIKFRQQTWQRAEELIAAHPWTGVGVGNVFVENGRPIDPQNIALLEAAEGGYVFAISFFVLVFGIAVALWRLRRVELAIAGAAVLLATVAHGLVDVYWVRGTPVLGWLLIGMVCALASEQKLEESR